jgi:cell division protein FtsB
VRVLVVILVVALGTLQYRLWVGDRSLVEYWRLEDAIAAQNEENEALENRNALLGAEVKDLKEGLEAIEERARRDLGMIRKDETFFQYLDDGLLAPR